MQNVHSGANTGENATNRCTANRAMMIVSGNVLLQTGLAEFVMHARQQLRVRFASQADAAPAVLRHVLHVHLQVVETSCQTSELTLDSIHSSAKLRNLIAKRPALCTLD